MRGGGGAHRCRSGDRRRNSRGCRRGAALRPPRTAGAATACPASQAAGEGALFRRALLAAAAGVLILAEDAYTPAET